MGMKGLSACLWKQYLQEKQNILIIFIYVTGKFMKYRNQWYAFGPWTCYGFTQKRSPIQEVINLHEVSLYSYRFCLETFRVFYNLQNDTSAYLEIILVGRNMKKKKGGTFNSSFHATKTTHSEWNIVSEKFGTVF